MVEHLFIFTPGIWLGQGTLTFNYSPEQIPFYTKWIIDPPIEGVIRALQQVQKQGEKEMMCNTFCFSVETESAFSVMLSTDLIGTVRGQGGIDNKIIAWEFWRTIIAQGTDVFEGFEVYELQDNAEYRFHAEYSSTEQYCTIVDGTLWQKNNSE